MVNGEPADPCRKAFVEPQLAPPVHGDQVAEPLVCQLVSDNICDTIAVAVRRCFGIEEDGSCTRLFLAKLCSSSTTALTGK